MKLPGITIQIRFDDAEDFSQAVAALDKLKNTVAGSSPRLSAVLSPATVPNVSIQHSEVSHMDPLSQAVADLTAAVEAEATIIDSVITYVKGVPALIDAAVAADVNNGALPQNLTAIGGLAAKLRSETDALTAALTANTIVPGGAPPTDPPPTDPAPKEPQNP